MWNNIYKLAMEKSEFLSNTSSLGFLERHFSDFQAEKICLIQIQHEFLSGILYLGGGYLVFSAIVFASTKETLTQGGIASFASQILFPLPVCGSSIEGF